MAPMVKAMQEQQEMIDSQKDHIRTLEERISRLEALLINKGEKNK
jgi:uncharacterized coiled-coil protein SlyX